MDFILLLLPWNFAPQPYKEQQYPLARNLIVFWRKLLQLKVQIAGKLLSCFYHWKISIVSVCSVLILTVHESYPDSLIGMYVFRI